jgi:hypothetical protein
MMASLMQSLTHISLMFMADILTMMCVCVFPVNLMFFLAVECEMFSFNRIRYFKRHTNNLCVVTIKPLTQACQNCLKLINVSIDNLFNDTSMSCSVCILFLILINKGKSKKPNNSVNQ